MDPNDVIDIAPSAIDPSDIVDVTPKINFFNDSIYDIQEKLELDEPPYVNDDPYEFKKAAQYGFANSLAGAMYHLSAIPGWADRTIDSVGRFFGGNPDQWKMNYISGDNISEEFKITTLDDYFKYQKQLEEKDNINQRYHDKSAVTRAGIYAAAWIDSLEEYYKDIAQDLTPEEMFGLDPRYKPEGLPEAIVSGFAGMPVTIAQYAGAIALAGPALGGARVALSAITPFVKRRAYKKAGGFASAVGGFSSLSFLGSYEEPLSKVASNTALGAFEGAMFGAVAKIPGWKTRTLGLAGVGAATAKMHGGGTTEMAAAAINLASLGIAGRGLEKLVGRNVITPEEQTKGSEGIFNIIPGWQVITKDLQTYHATLKHLNEFKQSGGKGTFELTEALPFEFKLESLEAMSKQRVPGRDTAASKYSDVAVLETRGRVTQRDIESGANKIRFKKRTLEEVQNKETGEVTVQEVTRNVLVDRNTVMVDGKLPYMKFYFDTSTKKIVTRAEADAAIKEAQSTKTPELKGSDTPIQRALFIQGRTIPTLESNARAFADIFKVKHYKDRYVEMTYEQLTKFNKDRKKQGAEWKKKAYQDATLMKEKLETFNLGRINEYYKDAFATLDNLGRIANLGFESGRTPGLTPFENAKELIESILSFEKDPAGFRLIKKDKKGENVESDIGAGEGAGVINKLLTNIQGYGIPIKLLGDPSKNSILRFLWSKVRTYETDSRMMTNDIFYRTKVDYKKPENSTFYIETDSGRSIGGFLFRLTGMRGLKTFNDKEGAFTLYDQLINKYGTAKGLQKMEQIKDVFINRELIMIKEAKKNLPKNATVEQIQKEYASRLENGKLRYQMPYERMQKEFKLDNELQNIVIKMDRGLANARIKYNKDVTAHPKQGAELIPELPNYFPRTWQGSHKIYLKDAEGRPVATFSADRRSDVEAQYALFKKNYPEYKDLTDFYVRKSIIGNTKDHNLREAFFETSRILEHKNPKLAEAVIETYKKHREGESFAKVKRTRKDVLGYRGSGTGKRAVDEFTETMKGYIESAVRAGEAIKFKDKTDAIFESKELNKYFPEQIKFGEKYIDNAFGRNESTISKYTEKLIDGMSQLPIFNKFGPRGIEQAAMLANQATLYTKLLFFNPRFIYSQIVQPYQMVPQRLEFLKQEYGIKGDVAKSIVEGSALTFRPTAEFKEVIKFLMPRGVLDSKFLNEFGIDRTTGGRVLTQGQKLGYGIMETVSGNRLSGRIERYSRLNAAAMIYSFLKDAKYDKTLIKNLKSEKKGKEKFFETIAELTDNVMVEYNTVNRPLLFGKQGLGTGGSLMGLFKTFQHNYYGQMIQYVRTWAKNDYKFEASKPLLFHMTGMLMSAGLFGILAANQIDAIIDAGNSILKKFGYKDRLPTYSEMVLLADIPKEVKFGLPSTLVGMDVSQTLTAPGLGISDVLSFPSLDYLFGLTSRSNEGVVGSSYNIIAKKISGKYTDMDMYKFLKATMPPIVMAEVERRYAKIPVEEVLFGPDEEDTQMESKYFVKGNDGRYIVANPYKNMYGQLERDFKGFRARYFAGRSFEESLILKTIWASTKLSRRQRDTITGLVNSAAWNVNNNNIDELMPIVDSAMAMGYTYNQFMEKVYNQVENMNDTILSRIKALNRAYKLDEKNFIFDVLKNNDIDLKFLPNN